MPAPTVEMGLGGSWAGVASSHSPDAYLLADMRQSSATRFGVRKHAPTPTSSGTQPVYSTMAWVDYLNAFGGVTGGGASSLPGGGLSAVFDGVDDGAFLVPINGGFLGAAAGTSAYSIEFVGVINATPGVGIEPALWGTSEFGLTYRNDGRIYGYYNNVAVVDVAASTGALLHVVMTRAGSSTDAVTLYLNGVSVDTATPARVSFADQQLYTGQHWTNAHFLSATVYGLGIYGTALTSGQVAASYAALSWTDVTQDVLGAVPLVCERGVRDDKPSSRVASTGTLAFSMNNLASNSGGVTGYYSPGNANCRTGFGKNTPVRVKSGSDVVWTGRIRSIAPSPGKTGTGTKVVATDYIDVAAVSLMENISALENVRGDEVFTNVVGLIPQAPNGVTTSVGTETYTLALDNTRDEAVSALSEFNRLALSELGYIYQTRTGRLVYENRNTRIVAASSASVTLNDTMHGLDVAEVSSSALNRVQITVHPRVIDAAATTVLYELVNALPIAAGETKTIIGPFRAATATGITTRVGGLQMVTPVATTDYTMNSAADGTGVDLTSSLDVVADYGPNGVRLTLINSATDAAHVTKMQCRGKGVYDFRTVVLRAENDAAIASDGVNALNIDMVYQEDANVGQSLADLLLNGYGDLDGTRVRQVSFLPDAAGMPAGLWTKDISDRVAVSETVTGATGEYYINGVKHEYQNGTLPRITWWLSPAEPVSYWVLDTSTLGDNTMLGV